VLCNFSEQTASFSVPSDLRVSPEALLANVDKASSVSDGAIQLAPFQAQIHAVVST
jgi:hypothetical protein